MRGRKLPARPAKPGDTNSAQRACRPSEPPGSLIDSLLRGRFARSAPRIFYATGLDAPAGLCYTHVDASYCDISYCGR